MTEIDAVQVTIFVALFAGVTVMGFLASRWRRSGDLHSLHEWGLGGRSFGSWVTWFLLGGDLYTAYTFIAVPALIFTAGAAGFFAIPYTIIAFPLFYLVVARLWSVSHQHGCVTSADFVRIRHGSPTLALLIAITGIVATMPYVALQLVGISAVLTTMGIPGELPIIVAFLVLAAYTYSSGLRAPALIAIVKDTLIYIVVIAAVLVIPWQLGGWTTIFQAASEKFATAGSGSLLLAPTAEWNYATVALGSALALFLYPHSVTGVLASRSRGTVKRNMAALPVYSLLLGFIALLGFMAIAADVTPLNGANGKPDTNTVVPELFNQQFPAWFSGLAFAAIGIGALVPAAIMSIAAANLWTRNIYKEYLRKDASPKQEAASSKIASLLVKFGALLAVLLLAPDLAIQLQLIGGVIVLQTLPAVALGLFTGWFDRRGLIAGWAAGMASGVWMLYVIPSAGRAHFGGSAFPLSNLGLDTQVTVYAGIIALAVNLAVAAAVTVAVSKTRRANVDLTRPSDYTALIPK